MSHKTHMNGDGESYNSVIPTKQPNEGQGGPKEVVEGRLLTRENADQLNPCRTQSRESGPNGLGRVREAAMNASTPESEVGTVCVSSASTGLYGGRPVMVVPTVTWSEPPN
jgi:hypothetical protein